MTLHLFSLYSRYLLCFFALTLAIIPTPAKAECNEAMCCEETCCQASCSRAWWWSGSAGRAALVLGGAALVGGVAGAIAGNAAGGGRGPRGPAGEQGLVGPAGEQGAVGETGATGPAGPTAFVTDPNNTLNFSFFIDITGGTAGIPVTVIPFVSRPDGTVVEGSATNFITPIPPTIPGILIDGPVYGTYQVGLNIEPLPAGVTIDGTYINPVFTSRDGASTVVTSPLAPVLTNVLGGTNLQITNQFTYDPVNIP